MEAACGSRVSLAPAALRRGSARRCPAGRRPAPACRAGLTPQSAAEAAWPWLATSAGPLQVRAEAPPVTPRFMDGAGPTDPMALLMRQRIVFLGTQVDDFTADAVVSQLLYLDAQEPGKDIKLFINSPGGSVTAGMGIYDAMQMCRSDVSTVCFGLAASMGAFLLTAGAKGKRLSMPNARIMIHQPLGGASGQAVDIEIQAKEIMYHKGNLNRILAYHTGQPVEKIDEDTDRDRYMSPLEAKQYGLIDTVIGGDDAGLKVSGDPKDFLKTRAAYTAWGDDGGKDGGDRSSRFAGAQRIPSTDVPPVSK